jgi:hypothetical protein
MTHTRPLFAVDRNTRDDVFGSARPVPTGVACAITVAVAEHRFSADRACADTCWVRRGAARDRGMFE